MPQSPTKRIAAGHATIPSRLGRSQIRRHDGDSFSIWTGKAEVIKYNTHGSSRAPRPSFVSLSLSIFQESDHFWGVLRLNWGVVQKQQTIYIRTVWVSGSVHYNLPRWEEYIDGSGELDRSTERRDLCVMFETIHVEPSPSVRGKS